MVTDERFRGPLAAALPSDWSSLLRSPAVALPLSPATDRAVWTGIPSEILDPLAAIAEAERATPWPQPRASDAARVHRDGNRTSWETPAFARTRRLTRAALMAAVHRSEEWLDEVADGVILLCEQTSWCWPAHDDTFERHGSVLATPADPFLDLGAGEVVAQLAWIDHLLGTDLDARYPGLRDRVRTEARHRVFEPFLTRRDWHWIGLDGDVHNWNPWIHGNVLVAALRLLDRADDTEGDAAPRTRVAELAVEGLDRYVAVLPDDGAIDEGYEYWWNGACRALEALDVLAHATDGAAAVTAAIPSLRATVAFPHRMHLGGGWYVDFADGQARPEEPKNWHSLARAADLVGDHDARAHAYAQRSLGAPLVSEQAGAGRVLRAVSDPTWTAADPGAAEPPLPARVWLPSVEVAVFRPRAGSARGLALAMKGGHNGEHHNHNDVGSFIVTSDGVPVVVDPGRPTYTKQTFGPRRYDIWTMQSSWHGVPVIDGRPQSPGAAFAAREVEVTDTGLSLDLAGAYEAAVDGLRRTAELDGDVVTVVDRWRGSASVVEHLIVAGDVTLLPGGARVRPLDGASPVRLRWDAAHSVTVTERPLDDPMLAGVWGPRLTRIEIDAGSTTTFSLTVERDDMIAEDDE